MICIGLPPLILLLRVLLLPGEEYANILSKPEPGPIEIARPGSFVLLVVLTMCALIVFISSEMYKEAALQLGRILASALRFLGAAITLVLLWISIVVFNATPPEEPSYRLAKLYDSSNALLICGLLVLATDSEYAVWGRGYPNLHWVTSVWSKAGLHAAIFTSRWKLGAFRDANYESECAGAAATHSTG